MAFPEEIRNAIIDEMPKDNITALRLTDLLADNSGINHVAISSDNIINPMDMPKLSITDAITEIQTV